MTAPAGTPASSRMATNAAIVSGDGSAGLSTAALPVISAAAIFAAGSSIGKFHGEIATTTPSGTVCVNVHCSPGRWPPSTSPVGP